MENVRSSGMYLLIGTAGVVRYVCSSLGHNETRTIEEDETMIPKFLYVLST